MDAKEAAAYLESREWRFAMGNTPAPGDESYFAEHGRKFSEALAMAVDALALMEKREQGLVLEKPCNRGDGIFCITSSHYGKDKKIEERTVRGMRLLDYEKQPNSWTVSVHPTQQNDANLQFVWGRGAFATRADAEGAVRQK